MRAHTKASISASSRPTRGSVFTSCDIFRVAGDKIVEHWGMGDIAGVIAQLKGIDGAYCRTERSREWGIKRAPEGALAINPRTVFAAI